MPPAPDGLYENNLRTLRVRQPDAAQTLDFTPLPPNINFTTGRDGSPTCLLPADGDRRRWFGGSSMPSVSAEAAFSTYQSDGRNVALPGILTGQAPLVLLKRLPQHTAIFVVEPTTSQLKIALHLRDYSVEIEKGRLVFLLGQGEEFVLGVRRFFEQHPGYEIPVHLLTVIQQSTSAVAGLQRQLEEAGQAAMDVHARRVEDQVRRLIQAVIPREIPAEPRLAILSVDPNEETQQHVERTRRALLDLGWHHDICIPNAPQRCHVSQRLQTVLDINADFILLVNSNAGAMRSFLPPHCAIANWYTPNAHVQPNQEDALFEREAFFASSAQNVDALVRAGVPADRIHECPPAADHTVFRPATPGSHERSHNAIDVLLDIPDDRPESWRVDLASHVALWNAIRHTVQQSADRYRIDVADTFLEDAQRISGTTLKDPKIRDHFLTLTKSCIAPAALARATIERIRRAGLSISIWGGHWSPTANRPASLGQDDYHGPIPTGDSLRDVIRRARWILIPNLSPALVSTALDALVSGTRIACRHCDTPFDRLYPGLSDATRHFNFYETADQLLKTILDDVGNTAAQTQAEILEKHTIAQRLITIADTMRTAPTVSSS